MSAILGFLSLGKLVTLFGGGALGFVTHLFSWHTKAATTVKRVPRWAWIALAVVIALLSAYLFHRHEVHKFKVSVQQAQMATDNDYWKQKLAAAHADALRWKGQYEAAQTAIANQERKRHEETVRDNAAIADALRVRGPGAATSHCGPINPSTAPTGAGESGQTTSAGSASAAGVPSKDWATVPWRWLVNVVQQHDDLISEAMSWRNDKAKQNELYQRSVQQSTAVKR